MFLRAFCSGGSLAARSIAARSSLLVRPSAAQTSVQLYRTSPSMNVGARSALYRFDFDNGHGEGHWKLERYLAGGLLVTIPVGLAFPVPALDHAITAMLLLHAHLGLEAVVFDYLHYRPKIFYYGAMGLVYMCSLIAFCGVTYFNWSNMGILKAIKQLWSIEGKK